MSQWIQEPLQSKAWRAKRHKVTSVDGTSANYSYTLFDMGFCRLDFGPAQLAKA